MLVDPIAQETQTAIAHWREGDRALVIHLFGGIGGEQKNERVPFLNLVTGHFAYGTATVVCDPLSDELRFALEYQQVYAHNVDGIVAGSTDWSNYMGDLQWGWLGTRPVSDVVVKLDAITEDYDFDGTVLSPLTELKHALEIMMARYRVGDGTGASLVTPSRSCVQDSNQGLYLAIQQIEKQVQEEPSIQAWLQSHPDHPQTLRFQQLVTIGEQLEKQLTPLGLVRRDWQQHNETLVGSHPSQCRLQAILQGITSWRTMLPRRAHDEVARLLLQQGAQLWFLRTNQVGGVDPSIVPLAPTTLAG